MKMKIRKRIKSRIQSKSKTQWAGVLLSYSRSSQCSLEADMNDPALLLLLGILLLIFFLILVFILLLICESTTPKEVGFCPSIEY